MNNNKGGGIGCALSILVIVCASIAFSCQAYVLGAVLLFVSFVLAIIYLNKKSEEESEAREKSTKDIEKIIKESGITKTSDLSWHDHYFKNGYRLIADDVKKSVFIRKGLSSTWLDEIPYADIIGSEIVEDAQVVSTGGGIIRSAVGGAVFGLAGAIAGAQKTTKSKVESLQVIIYRKSISTPTYVISLIEQSTDITSSDYTSAKQFAINVEAIVKAILANK